MNSRLPVASKPTPVGSGEYPGVPLKRAALAPHTVPEAVTVPSRCVNQMFASFQPAPVGSSTSESTTTRRSGPGIHATPEGSGEPGDQVEVGVARTNVAVCTGGASAAPASAAPATGATSPAASAASSPTQRERRELEQLA